MLGLEEGGGKDEHTSSIQGGYLSFLYLRHLRIRDLQRTVSTNLQIIEQDLEHMYLHVLD